MKSFSLTAGRIVAVVMLIILTRLAQPALASWPHGGQDELPHCTGCHSAHSATSQFLLRGGTAMCSSCHAFQAPAGLWPGLELYEKSAHAGLCTDCHNPHGEKDELGKIPHLAVERGEKLCLSCHREFTVIFSDSMIMEQRTGVPSRHHVDIAGSGVTCVDCHNPHLVEPIGNEYAAIVTNPMNPLQKVSFRNRNIANKFCITCHNGSRAQAPEILAEIQGDTVVSEFRSLVDDQSLHRVHLTQTHKQNCLLCHEPHATTGTNGINRGHLLYNMKVNHFNQGYPGYNSCDTLCHGVRCGSCHPLPPFDRD